MTSPDLYSQIQEALSKVSDPELHRPITDLGMVSGVDVENGSVKLKILLTISGCPMRDRLESDITKAVSSVPGITSIELEFGVMSDEQRANVKKILSGGREKFIPFAQPNSLKIGRAHV